MDLSKFDSFNHAPNFTYTESSGLSLRDLFALEAIKIYLQQTGIGNSGMFLNEAFVGRAAYAVADNMLEARNKQPKEK